MGVIKDDYTGGVPTTGAKMEAFGGGMIAVNACTIITVRFFFDSCCVGICTG